MKLTKKLEAEVTKVYDIWLHSYLNGDLKTYDSYLDKDYHFIGSTDNEDFLTRKETTKFFKTTAEQLAGNCQIKNNIRIIEKFDELVFITERFNANFLIGKKWVYYGKFRFSSVMHKKQEGWRFIYQHFSLPDSKAQDGETMGADQVSKENQELRDAIKRRTAELEIINRELEIETSLERVRASSMAMHNTSELQAVIHTVHKELLNLNIAINGGSFIAINSDVDTTLRCWGSGGTADTTEEINIPLYKKPFCTNLINKIKKGPGFFTEAFTQKEKKDFFTFLFTHEPWKKLNAKQKNETLLSPGGYTRSCFVSKHSSIFIINHFGEIFSAADNDILQRFGKVFEQTYTRFLDLQKAEAQAREAEIELSLERVRARSLAMKSSEELLAASDVMFTELERLSINALRIGVCTIDGKTGSAEVWSRSETKDQKKNKILGIVPKGTHPVFDNMVKAWKGKKPYYSNTRTGNEVSEYYKKVSVYLSYPLPKKYNKQETISTFFFPEGSLNVVSLQPLHANEIEIMVRFANVFGQIYQRFLDLQKAEAQAREAEIELALERVRARTMAMQHSEELADASLLLDQQVRGLGIKTRGCAFNIYGEKESTEWFSSEMGTMPTYKTPREKIFLDYYQAGQKGETFLTKEFSGKECIDWYNYLCTLPVMGDSLKQMIAAGGSFPIRQIDHVSFFKYGYLLFLTFEPVPEAHEIFKRFAKVFEQTYTRFLDLQKAEASAREAQIEAAVERVRAEAMAMHSTSDFEKVVKQLLQQIQHLNLEGFTGAQIILIDEKEFLTTWDCSSPGNIGDPKSQTIRYEAQKFPIMGVEILNKWKEGKPYFVMDFDLKKLRAAVKEWEEINVNIAGIISDAISGGHLTHQWDACGRLFNGMIAFDMIKPPDDDVRNITIKMTHAFEQAYIRFMDLQKAEAQARETQIELALERVRARTMSMQRSDELMDTSMLLFQQVGKLGINSFAYGFNIWDDDKKFATAWMASKDRLQPPFKTNSGEDVYFLFHEAEKRGESLFILEQKGKELEEHYKYLVTIPEVKKLSEAGLSFPTFQIIHCAYFSKGYLMFITLESVPDAHDIFKRFAKVFEQTYTRFLDLQKAEAQALKAEKDLIEIKIARKKAEEALSILKTTQKQLIQSEKMASLGELTAGIAHEIQNPLNFVNNFSEVSKELLDEMKEEMGKGNLDDVREIMKDVIQNLEKINHHGKRADGIVKGMLQHSQSSTGKKEPTDINALCDEYLRLSYHGLRAKDKSFNADFKTNFDESIGKINIIPQDIGRVILNLINNAFYAVDEKKKSGIENFEPTVSLSTKKISDKVEIIVTDNGNGVPQKVLDKIFQPFFTTKPTGQGTGLGLSLSYDIIKAHGGEIKVKTQEGKGTNFIIHLSVNSNI